jgi:hypothetical protein
MVEAMPKRKLNPAFSGLLDLKLDFVARRFLAILADRAPRWRSQATEFAATMAA